MKSPAFATPFSARFSAPFSARFAARFAASWTPVLLLLGTAALAQNPPSAPAPAPEPAQSRIQYVDDTQQAPTDASGAENHKAEDARPIDLSKIHDAVTRNRLEQLIKERGLAASRKPIVQYKREPWLAANGEQLVGIVNARELTRPQLAERVKLALSAAPPLHDPSLEEDRRAVYEDALLNAWIENTVIAEYAKSKKIEVTDKEIDQALEQMFLPLASGGSQRTTGFEASQFVGLRENELRQEARDGLLTDKAVRRGIHELFDDNSLRQIYNKDPRRFLMPTRVHVWQIYCPAMTYLAGQDDNVVARMKTLRKKLDRAKTPEDYAALQQEVGTRRDMIERSGVLARAKAAGVEDAAGSLAPSKMAVMSDMKWVNEDDVLPMFGWDLQKKLHDALFNLKPGKTSDVVKTEIGYHVVKVVERVEGEAATFERAEPRIENALYNQVKEVIYAQVSGQYKIFINSSGLTKNHRVQSAGLPLTGADAPGSATLNGVAGQANASSLRNPPSVEETLRIKAEIDLAERAMKVHAQH